MRLRWFLDGRRTEFTWCDLIAFIDTCGRESALFHVDAGEEAQWGLTETIGALIADNIALLRYSMTASKGDPLPPLLSSRFIGAAADNGTRSAASPNLNDRDRGGVAAGESWSMVETARALGWDIEVVE